MSEGNQLREVSLPPQSETAESTDLPPAGRSGGSKRLLLMVAIPGLLIAGAVYLFLHAGRFVSTDNAYVKGHIINMTAEVSGPIVAVGAEKYAHVAAGAELIRLRKTPFRIALDRAEAATADIRTEIEADKLAYRRAIAEIDLQRTNVSYAQAQYARQVGLRDAKLGTVQDLDTTKYELDAARRQLEITGQEAAGLLTRLNGDPDIPVAEHPRYREAEAMRAQAALDLAHTVVQAPVNGVVTQRPEAGDYVQRGAPVLALIADEGIWVEANFKETQMTHVREGQEAEIRIDTYPGEVWQGHVEYISEATGAEFALLPPQNATGNWVKIVQRIPVRVAIDDEEDLPPLRLGMSSTVTVDTRVERSWHDLIPDW